MRDPLKYHREFDEPPLTEGEQAAVAVAVGVGLVLLLGLAVWAVGP